LHSTPYRLQSHSAQYNVQTAVSPCTVHRTDCSLTLHSTPYRLLPHSAQYNVQTAVSPCTVQRTDCSLALHSTPNRLLSHSAQYNVQTAVSPCTVHRTHPTKDLTQYAATSPNSPAQRVLTDCFNDYDFSYDQ